jgi:hypothetical protein
LPPIPLPIPFSSSAIPGNDSGKVRSKANGHGAVLCSQAVSFRGTVRRGQSRIWRVGPTTPMRWRLNPEEPRDGGNGPGRPMERSTAPASADVRPASRGGRR